MFRCVKILTTALIMFVVLNTASRAQYKYFYSGKDYGSESMYNPVNFALNSGFDIIQYER